MAFIAIILYLILCLLVGLMGRYTRLGYFGTSVLALLVTPPLAVLLLLGLAESAERRGSSGEPRA